MILYIVNILYDNLKNKLEVSNRENFKDSIVKDARYIADFAGIRENKNILEINTGLMNILEIIKRYKVSTVDTLDILEIILGNKHNNWIIKRCFKENLNNNGEEIALTTIVNDIIKRDGYGVLDNIENLSEDLRMLILKAIFMKIKDENKKALERQKLDDVS